MTSKDHGTSVAWNASFFRQNSSNISAVRKHLSPINQELLEKSVKDLQTTVNGSGQNIGGTRESAMIPVQGVNGVKRETSAAGSPPKRQRQNRANETPIPEDGFLWRKYGQKPLVDIPYNRAYYCCARKKDGCKAKKTVDRRLTDSTFIRVCYEGRHNHSPPPPKQETEVIIYRPIPSPQSVSVEQFQYSPPEVTSQSSPGISSSSESFQSGFGDNSGSPDPEEGEITSWSVRGQYQANRNTGSEIRKNVLSLEDSLRRQNSVFPQKDKAVEETSNSFPGIGNMKIGKAVRSNPECSTFSNTKMESENTSGVGKSLSERLHELVEKQKRDEKGKKNSVANREMISKRGGESSTKNVNNLVAKSEGGGGQGTGAAVPLSMEGRSESKSLSFHRRIDSGGSSVGVSGGVSAGISEVGRVTDTDSSANMHSEYQDELETAVSSHLNRKNSGPIMVSQRELPPILSKPQGNVSPLSSLVTNSTIGQSTLSQCPSQFGSGISETRGGNGGEDEEAVIFLAGQLFGLPESFTFRTEEQEDTKNNVVGHCFLPAKNVISESCGFNGVTHLGEEKGMGSFKELHQHELFGGVGVGVGVGGGVGGVKEEESNRFFGTGCTRDEMKKIREFFPRIASLTPEWDDFLDSFPPLNDTGSDFRFK